MVPKPPSSSAASGAKKMAARPLPPVPKLRVRRPNASQSNPCLTVMSSVLSCWASSGYNVQGCAALENQLRACMDAPKPVNTKKNTINYHLARMYTKIIGPHKRK